MNWIDIGINLTNKRYQSDRMVVIKKAMQVGVNAMIITGTSVEESLSAVEMTQLQPDVLYSTAGCHPHEAKQFSHSGLEILEDLIQRPQVVAVGECGLDFNRNFSPKEQQIAAFKQQLELAVKWQKPVFLHERDAFDTQYQILKDYLPSLKNAVSHCFTGTQDNLDKYLELGLSIGITGWICDERRGQALFNSVKTIPDERLMIETDGPYLTPRNLAEKPKNGRNEPQYLPHIAQTVAHARQQSLSHIAKICYRNSQQFFNLNI